MDAYVEKVQFFKHNLKKIFRPLHFLSYFYYCFKAAAKTNTIFHYGTKCAGRFVDHKYFSNFLGTVPTFGFRISIVKNVRSQNFIKNWLSEVRKIYRISLIFEWPMYMNMVRFQKTSIKSMWPTNRTLINTNKYSTCKSVLNIWRG